MIHKRAILTVNAVFIHQLRADTRNGTFPEITVMDTIHRCLCPSVKFPDHRNTAGSWCKGTESCSFFLHMSSQVFIGFKFFSCIKIIKIHTFLLPK